MAVILGVGIYYVYSMGPDDSTAMPMPPERVEEEKAPDPQPSNPMPVEKEKAPDPPVKEPEPSNPMPVEKEKAPDPPTVKEPEPSNPMPVPTQTEGVVEPNHSGEATPKQTDVKKEEKADPAVEKPDTMHAVKALGVVVGGTAVAAGLVAGGTVAAVSAVPLALGGGVIYAAHSLYGWLGKAEAWEESTGSLLWGDGAYPVWG